jgi:acetyltransferase-like isoleucine patch superfamily enzyme
MFKKITLILLQFTGKSISYIFPYKFSNYYNIIKSLVYSSWISTNFKNFGKGSIISPNCTLWGGEYISIGEKCIISNGAVLTAWDKHGNERFTPRIIIGKNVSIGSNCHISAINLIQIGDNVLTGKKVTIIDNSHGKSELKSLSTPPALRALFSKGPIQIDNNVWIGDKVTILSNVHIGKNSIIGANSVVTQDVPPNCIVGGIPAKIIKMIE